MFGETPPDGKKLIKSIDKLQHSRTSNLQRTNLQKVKEIQEEEEKVKADPKKELTKRVDQGVVKVKPKSTRHPNSRD